MEKSSRSSSYSDVVSKANVALFGYFPLFDVFLIRFTRLKICVPSQMYLKKPGSTPEIWNIWTSNCGISSPLPSENFKLCARKQYIKSTFIDRDVGTHDSSYATHKDELQVLNHCMRKQMYSSGITKSYKLRFSYVVSLLRYAAVIRSSFFLMLSISC